MKITMEKVGSLFRVSVESKESGVTKCFLIKDAELKNFTVNGDIGVAVIEGTACSSPEWHHESDKLAGV